MGHAKHFVTLLVDADEALLAAVHGATTSFRAHATHCVAVATREDSATQQRLRAAQEQWTHLMSELRSGEEKVRGGALERIADNGRDWFQMFGDLFSTCLSNTTENSQVNFVLTTRSLYDCAQFHKYTR